MESPPRRSRILLARLALLLGALVLCEAGLRVGAALTGRTRGLERHPVYGWKPRPNISKQGAQWGPTRPARTSSRGWRDREHEQHRGEGMQRLVVVGDSFVFGSQVDDGERFTDLLDQEPGVEVLNLGVNAFGTDQALLVLEDEGFDLQPTHALLVAFLANDLFDILHERRHAWPKPVFLPTEEGLVLRPPEVTWDVVLRESSYLGELLYRAASPLLERSRRSPELGEADAVPLFLALVERAAQAADARGVELVVVLAHPPENLREQPPPRERLALQSLLERDQRVIDTRPALLADPEGFEACYAPDGHWNARGHAEVARLITTSLALAGAGEGD